ncbi:phospholipase [Alphaproteobacteria bacterium]|nr:phospholipase [Alphaproteobacteria bacterium]
MEESVIKSKTEPKRIMFIFHGYGADKGNFQAIGETFAKVFDDLEVHIPDGIEKCDENDDGYQWFPLYGDVDDYFIEYKKNEHIIKEYVDDVLEKSGLTYANAIFAGFSQGAMLSIILGLKLGVSHVVSFSGVLIDQNIKDFNLKTKLVMIHGESDAVVPFDMMIASVDVLRRRGLGVYLAVSETAKHFIDDYMMQAAVKFLLPVN